MQKYTPNREKGHKMKESKFPQMSKADITKEIIARTGMKSDVINLVMKAYTDIVYEAYSNGIEVRLPNIGVLSFQDKPPRPAGMYWNGYAKEKTYFLNRPGYYRPLLVATRDFKQALKGRTIYGEERSEEEYDEWVRQAHPKTWEKRRLKNLDGGSQKDVEKP